MDINGIRVVAPDHRLFRPLTNLMIFNAALTHTLVSVGLSQQKVGPGTYHTLQSDVAERQILLPGFGPLEDAIAGRPPRSFEVAVRAANMVHGTFQPLANIPGYMDHMLAAIFVFYYETCRVWLEANSHGDSTKWPMTIDFARHVRNGLAHNGQLEIKIPKKSGIPYRTVTWCKLAYSHADDGRLILGTDLFGPDLIALMLDVDDEMVALRAPR